LRPGLLLLPVTDETVLRPWESLLQAHLGLLQGGGERDDAVKILPAR
jgi:hypothetical protein